MTNAEKGALIAHVRRGKTFQDIRDLVDCSDSTIKRYMKIFSKDKELNPQPKE